MKLIVGLGNPGKVYINSRHNIGFLVIKALSQFLKIPLKKDKEILSLNGRGKIRNQNIILAMPLTFMNLSGLAVSALIKKYKIDLPRLRSREESLDNVLVVCDDLDLEFGRLKIRPYGSSGGHQGLQSTIDYLNSDRFPRLRIGIGRRRPNTDAAEYVLSTFSKEEKVKLKGIIARACDCCQTWITQDITKSMNIFNRRSENNE